MNIRIETPKGFTDLSLNENLFQLSVKPTEDSIFPMLISGYPDIFGNGYIGYWARGLKFFKEENFWLCYEMGDDHPVSEKLDKAVLEEFEQVRTYKHGNKLWFSPNEIVQTFNTTFENRSILCFVIGPALAGKAFVEAYKKWGQESIDNWDAFTVDYGLQMALYGKIKWS